MTTRSPLRNNSPHHADGKVSLAVVLGLCLVLLLVALGLAGYAWYSTRSENARLQSEARRVEEAAKAAELQRQNEELLVQKAEAAARLTLAKNQQEAFSGSVRKLTNTLESLLVQIPAWEEQLKALRTGEPGRTIALHPELVASARVLFERDARAVPTREEAAQHLEALRRVLLQLADHAGTAFQPTPEMTGALEQAQTWTATATGRLAAAKDFAASLLREAQVKVPPASAATPPTSLQVAIETLKESERKAYLAKETKVIGEATTQATNLLLTVRSNQIANDAEIARQQAEAEAKRKQAEQEARTAQQVAMARIQEEEARRIEQRQRASTSEVQGKLAPFITPGYFQVKGRSYEKRPYSFSALQGCGALNENDSGLRKLADFASAPKDDVRPRWKLQRGPVLFVNVASEREKVVEVQQLLRELGPVLVEMKLLDP